MPKPSTAKPFYVCAHCDQPFVWMPKRGRPPATCSSECKREHRKAWDRDRHEKLLVEIGHKRVRSSKYRTYLCSIEGCERRGNSGGLCALHYNRVRLTGDPGPAGLKKRPAGKGYIDKKTGYVYIHSAEAGRAVLEHRLVVERALGRQLESWENIHHRNGRRSDNRPQNLEIWVIPQPTGQRPAELLVWCDENRALIEQDAEWNLRIGA
jgi:hypothetical protein